MTLIPLTAAWLAGVVAALHFDVSAPALALLAASATLLAALLRSTGRPALPALLAAVLLLAMARVEVTRSDDGSDLARYYRAGPVQVRGVVTGDPEAAGAATRLRLRVEAVYAGDDWIAASGDVLVTLNPPPSLASSRTRPYFRYGDRLRLDGVLAPPPELDRRDYPAYLARQGIGSVMSFPQATLLDGVGGNPFYRWLYGVRRSIARSLAGSLPEPQASLGQAVLLGLRDDLPDKQVQQFQETGTSHLLAISGLNVSILMGIALAVSAWVLGRRRQLYLAGPFALLWLYALIAGMSPSVARAAVMGSVYLLALAVGRPRSTLPALAFAAALMTAVDPQVIRSISFQLSFAAMAGIAAWAEPLGRLLAAGDWRRADSDTTPRARWALPAEAAAMTIAATVATLPLVAFHFHSVSLVGMPATLLTLPALPAVLVTQAATGLAGLASHVLATPFSWLAWLSTSYIVVVVDVLARLPVASVETGRLASLLVWTYFVALALAHVAASERGTVARWLARVPPLPTASKMATRAAAWWALAFVASTAALVWTAALSLPDGKLHVVFADVGQGDAALIITPGGKQVLVDGGPDPLGAVRLLGASMPFRDRTIELVVLTHPHTDHVTGLTEVLLRYDVKRVVEREVEYDSPAHVAWRRAVADEGAIVTEARAGQVIVLEKGVAMQVLGPAPRLLRGTRSDVDNASVALRLVYGDVSFLLAGDMFAEAERALVYGGSMLDSDVLKVGHHGSRNASTEGFLHRVSPSAAVISAGEGNRFGHPHAEALGALRRLVPEEMVFLTRDRGTVEFVTDGKRLRVKTER